MAVKVLVVDDSALAREFIQALLAIDPEIVVVGEASNGQEALSKTRALRPDLIIMDIEMPVMGGLEAIERIMAEIPTPILVVTARGGAETAFMAISKGALEVLAKSDLAPDQARQFAEQVKLLSRARVITHLQGRSRPLPEVAGVEPLPFANIIAIAASTGGPSALNVILPHFPRDFRCPIVIAQHIAEGFVAGLVEWLAKSARITVKVAADGDRLRPGWAYISPPDHHLAVNFDHRLVLLARRSQDIYYPSCDTLLEAVAEVYGPRAIGVILTGMGTDGVRGLLKIKERGGRTIAQDQATSIVYGMPARAVEAGCVDQVWPVQQIGQRLLAMVSG